MPRSARVLSDTGTYHVMLRGINRQQLFEDKQDREKFLQVLRECKEISGFRLHAYCLMGNHIHLLISPQKEPLETIFRRIGARFVYWYNIKYQRNGHLFQDRYKSEPIKDDAQFVVALKYVLQNPVKDGLCKKAEQYLYSSASVYVNGKDDGLTDIQPAKDMIAGVSFEEFLNEPCTAKLADMSETQKHRLTDEQAENVIWRVSKCSNASEFQALPPDKRNKHLVELYKAGLSVRQASRLTGISKGIVERTVKNR